MFLFSVLAGKCLLLNIYLDKPEVWVEQDVVQGGLGEQGVLVCRVQGYPLPDIRLVKI